MTAGAGARLGRAAGLALALGACAQAGPLTDIRDAAPADLPERPDTVSALQQGIALLRAKEPELAYRAFLQSLRTEHEPAAALAGAGMASQALGLLGRARWYLERSAELAPHSHVTQNNLGVVLYNLGEYAEAEAAFRAAFALSSGRNAAAGRNLEMAERRRAHDALPAEAPGPRIERLGDSAYRLVPAGEDPAGQTQDVESE